MSGCAVFRYPSIPLLESLADVRDGSYVTNSRSLSSSPAYPQIAVAPTACRGPCPPEHQRLNYRWTVKALDAGGKTLATTSATSPFPPRWFAHVFRRQARECYSPGRVPPWSWAALQLRWRHDRCTRIAADLLQRPSRQS